MSSVAAAQPVLRVELGGVRERGWAVDLTGASRTPSAVAAAVRDPADPRIDCPVPGPVHEHAGLVAPAVDRPGRAALAAVARSLGHEPPQRDRIERVRTELDAIDPPSVDLAAARERVAEAGDDVERLRERVATLQGRVRALREADADPSEAETELETAVRELSEAETERAAAEQALDRGRDRARQARDDRERRFGLEDRLANLERRARADLADRVRDRVDAAVVAAPGGTATTLDGVDPVTARLALARVADLDAPVVLACRRFPGARAAADWLDAPVLRL